MRLPRSLKVLLAVATLAFTATTARPSYAAVRYLCANWVYTFNDFGQGEDYLLPQFYFFGTPFGEKPAIYALAQATVNGQVVWTGYLNGWGCGGPVSTGSGTFSLKVWSWLYKDTTGTTVIVRNTDTGAVPTFAYTMNLDATSQDQLVGSDLALGTNVGSVASVMTEALARFDNGFMNNVGYYVNADQNCPDLGPNGEVFDACLATNGQLYLGHDVDWDYDLAFNKSTVGHELGHLISSKLYGTTPEEGSYTENAGGWCACEGITTTGSPLHCMQSREKFGAAISEGWGHSYAQGIYNNSAESTAYFAYYKEFQHPLWSEPLTPPVVFQTYDQWKWKNTICPISGRGVELDWMGFFSSVRRYNVNVYTHPEIGSIFKKACTGSSTTLCTSSNPALTWTKLTNAVNSAEFGFTVDKRNYWATVGNNYGVNL